MRTKLFLLCIELCFTLATQGQNAPDSYQPFVEEGKGFDLQFGETMENSYQHWIDGDTVINGKTWKKVYNSLCWPHLDYRYFAALREEGKKVYAIAKGSRRPRLLYNFDLQVGSLLRCGVEGNSFHCLLDSGEQPDSLFGFEFKTYLRVESIDTVESCGTRRRRFKLTMLDPYKDYFKPKEDGGVIGNIVWVEGIGSGSGPFMPWMPLPEPFNLTSSGILFIDYYIGRTQIFLHEAFYGDYEANSLKSVANDLTGETTLFDLQGRRLRSQSHRGLYIRDGRKYATR